MSLLTNAVLKLDLAKMVGTTSASARSDILASITSAIQRSQEDFCNFGNWPFLEQFSDRCYIPLQAPYSTGTVTATQDSKTITGAGTTWTKDMEGSFFAITAEEFYEIRTFNSATSLDLTIPYQNTTSTGSAYNIYKRFYPLPLNFSRAHAKDAKINTPGGGGSEVICYSDDASFADEIVEGKPQWFAVSGNQRNNDYYNTSTVTVATSGTTSTWTVASGTLPTDIVDREVRIVGESRSYYIKTRSGATQFITYDTYVNPSDLTGTQGSSSSFAITPKDTQLIGFSHVPDQRYIFSMPYIKRLPELLLDSDVSPIVLAGYSNAFLTMCRRKLAEDGRVAMRADLVQTCIQANVQAMADAWFTETAGDTMKQQAGYRKVDRTPQGPSWIGR